MSIDEIISRAGGVRVIVERSAATRRPISKWAVHKWRSIGIDEEHWALLMQLVPGLTVETLYAANREVEKRNRPSRRAPARHALA